LKTRLFLAKAVLGGDRRFQRGGEKKSGKKAFEFVGVTPEHDNEKTHLLGVSPDRDPPPGRESVGGRLCREIFP